MIYFTAHTFKCVCHCRRAMFRVLGMYNFGLCTKIGFIIFFVRLIRCSPQEASLNKAKHFGSKWPASHSYHTPGLDTIFSHIYFLVRQISLKFSTQCPNRLCKLDHMFAGVEHTPQDFSCVLPPQYSSRIYQFFDQGIHYYQQVTVHIYRLSSHGFFILLTQIHFKLGKKSRCDELDFICLAILTNYCCLLQPEKFKF